MAIPTPAVPEGICTALVMRMTTDRDVAVKLYQISSSHWAIPVQEGVLGDGVALAVVAAMVEEQLVAKIGRAHV